MFFKKNIIKAKRDLLLSELKQEESMYVDGFNGKWNELNSFRYEMSKYINCSKNGDIYYDLSPKTTFLDNGHVIDHHALGYFAPMDFKRKGFSFDDKNVNKKISPVEQLSMFNDFLDDKNVRLIYVPMPCKVAVYPSIAVSNESIPEDEMVIPQWRNFIKQCALNEIEVVDCYNGFKSSPEMVFSKNHHLSPHGTRLIGSIIAQYISETTDNISSNINFVKMKDVIGSTIMSHSGNDNSREVGIELFESESVKIKENNGVFPYVGYCDSHIGIIGDCNTQSYRGTGFDITAHISGGLNYPVKYIGRYLPYANKDTLDKINKGILSDIKILIYVGFVSACFVRAYSDEMSWGNKMIKEEAFFGDE